MLAYCGIIGEDSRMSLDLMKIPELVGDIIRSQKSIWFEGMTDESVTAEPNFHYLNTILILIINNSPINFLYITSAQSICHKHIYGNPINLNNCRVLCRIQLG